MAKIIGLPKLSPTMEEGTLAAWTKKEGDTIDIDDLLAEVETDKATMEFRSFDKGVLLKILVPAGETLKPDTPVAIIGAAGEDISALLAGGAVLASGTALAVGTGKAAATQAVATPAAATAAPVATPAAVVVRTSSERIFASPLVRKTAREKGIDLAQIPGSGPHGRIVYRDLAAVPTAPVRVAQPVGRAPAVIVKASPMRKTIARRLVESKQQVPHFYLTIDIDARALVEAREQMNRALAKSGEKVSFNDIVIKAAAAALRKVPGVNASWMDGEIHLHQVVDISVAVSVEDGLVTPVVRDADRLGVQAISAEVKALADKARSKKLKPEEMAGGTFSISNLGMYGIEEFAAVINPPEGALLAVGALRDDVGVVDGAVAPMKKMKVTLSCDHRVVDGALGAQWLAEFRTLVENPLSMLL